MKLPIEWLEVSEEDSLRFENELEREVCSEHILSRVTVDCVGRREGRDDFLFRVSLSDHEYAVVHLTWQVECSPKWPCTTLFKHFDDFTSNWRAELE